jgi:hypothetical protein
LLRQAALLLVAALTATAPLYTPSQLDTMRQLQDAALHSDYAYRQTRWLCDHVGPRLSGSAGAAAAVRYVAGELDRLGLEVHLENVTVPHWVRGAEEGELTQFAGQSDGLRQKIVLTALGGSVATPPGGIEAPVVVVHDYDEFDKLPAERVQGSIVLFDVPFDQRLAEQGHWFDAYEQAVQYRGHGAVVAAKRGAVAALVRSVGGAAYRLPHTGGMRYDANVVKIPTAAVTAEDADLMARLAGEGALRMRLLLTPQTLAPAASANVIADIKGTTRPDEVVIVSGHLDSWDLGTGAIDDAVGVTAAMATVELLHELGVRPKRTVRMIAWMNEENGLAGGRTYAREHQLQVGKHVAALEADLGAGHPSGFSCHVAPNDLARLEPVRELLQRQGAGVLTLSAEPGGADVWPLDDLGVPTFGVNQDGRTYFNYHHTAADTFDKVSAHELAENVAALTVLTYALADGPALEHNPPAHEKAR